MSFFMKPKGYLLGYFKNGTDIIKEALITIEPLDITNIKDDRNHEIYDFIKADIVKVISIEDLQGNKVNTAYLLNRPPNDLKYEIKEAEVIRFKNCNFAELLPNLSYIAFYTSKIGALNKSKEIAKTFTGVRYYYYPNGKLKEKIYYIQGNSMNVYGYYNNEFNSLYYSWIYEPDTNSSIMAVREYVYDRSEICVAQFIIKENKVVNKNIYNKSNFIESPYLSKYK